MIIYEKIRFTLMSEITAVEKPLKKALILICEKCGAKIASESSENPSHVIQQNLKNIIKQSMPMKEYKAVLTGCISICPKDEISLGIINIETDKSVFYTIKKNDDEDDYSFRDILELATRK